MSDLDRTLEELIERGLLTRSDSGAGVAGVTGVTFSADSAVAREIAQWMLTHPEDKKGLTEERVAAELGRWYAASFQRLADSGGSDAAEQAANDARSALQCFLEAQAFNELGELAAKLVTGAREPEMLGQVVDDFTAAGVPVIFGEYRLKSLIGAGTSASVYEAERVDNALPVAVKILRGAFSSEEADVLRFLDEAKTANRVRHPNVVEIFDAGQTQGTRFVAMELLRGRSLERRWRAKGRRLPQKRVLEVMMHLLGVLAAAHEKSILHGAIRPSNIFITSDGLVKVLDFSEESLTRAPHIPPSPDTRVEAASFFAPEQVRGELLDPRSDLWSVGSTMLALLSGKPADIERKATLTSVLPGAGGPVLTILDRALRVARDERWQSAKEMWEAVAAIHNELPEPDEHVSDPGPGSVPIVDIEPAGPLSELVVLEAMETQTPAPEDVELIEDSPVEAVTTTAPTAASPPPPPTRAPEMPQAERLAEPKPERLAAAAPPTPGVSKPFLALAVIAIVATTVALTLRFSSRGQETTTSLTSGSASATLAPSAAPKAPASSGPIASGAPTDDLVSSALPLGPDGQPSPVTTGNTPESAGDKKNGDQCEAAAECKSGQCVDGVCCSSACTGTCVACNLKSFLGQCAEIPFGYDPDKECGINKKCDGDGSCGGMKSTGKRCKAGRECDSTFCVRGICCATECRGADGNCSTGICKRSLLIE